MQTMTSVVSSNLLDAVALLRFGRYTDAITQLKCAVSHILVDLEPSLLVPTTSTTSPAPMSLASVSAIPEEASALKHKIHQQDVSLFTKAFVTFTTPDNDSSTRRSTELSVVCLFNLSLAVHLEGVSSGRAHLLQKASQLYVKTYGILIDCGITKADPLAAVLLATIFNLAAVSASLCQVDVAAHWHSVYSQVYGWAVPTPSPAAATSEQELPEIEASFLSLLDPEDTKTFALHAMLFQSTNLSFAAAA